MSDISSLNQWTIHCPYIWKLAGRWTTFFRLSLIHSPVGYHMTWIFHNFAVWSKRTKTFHSFINKHCLNNDRYIRVVFSEPNKNNDNSVNMIPDLKWDCRKKLLIRQHNQKWVSFFIGFHRNNGILLFKTWWQFTLMHD